MNKVRIFSLACVASGLMIPAYAGDTGVVAFGNQLIGITDTDPRPVAVSSLSEEGIALVGVPAPVAPPEPIVVPTPLAVFSEEGPVLSAKADLEIERSPEPARQMSEVMPVDVVDGEKQIPAIPVTPITLMPEPKWEEPAIPGGALFPDSNGVIIANASTSRAVSIDNPWDYGVVSQTSVTDFPLYASGNLLTARGESIAYLNGASVARGDKIGVFNVADLRRNEIILEKDAVFYVVPLRKSVTIKLPSGGE